MATFSFSSYYVRCHHYSYLFVQFVPFFMDFFVSFLENWQLFFSRSQLASIKTIRSHEFDTTGFDSLTTRFLHINKATNSYQLQLASDPYEVAPLEPMCNESSTSTFSTSLSIELLEGTSVISSNCWCCCLRMRSLSASSVYWWVACYSHIQQWYTIR